MNNNSIRRIEKFQGFKSLHPTEDPYENILNGTYNEMMLRQEDKRMLEIREGIVILRHFNFKDLVKTGGPWDHKPVIKKYAPSFYHKKLRNGQGKAATVFGTYIPGDAKYIYDHDIWSNIHYGYVGRMSDISGKLLEKGARAHDYLTAGKKDINTAVRRIKNPSEYTIEMVQEGKKLSKAESSFISFWEKVNPARSLFEAGADDTDMNAVRLGIKLFDKYGLNLKKSDLEREIFENRDGLNRFDRRSLIEKAHRVVKGDTLFGIARENNVAPEEILKKNPELKDFTRLTPGTVLKMPDPLEIRQLSAADAKGILSSSEYLYGRDAVHDLLIELMRQHFESSEKNAALSEELAEEAGQSAKTPTGTAYYVWHTLGDSKVREGHAEKEGGIFCWANPPEGGHPGDDYNCRCIALAYSEKDFEMTEFEGMCPVPDFDVSDFVPLTVTSDDEEGKASSTYDGGGSH